MNNELFDWVKHAQPAIDQSYGNANEDWRAAAIRCLRHAAKIHDEFTSDEVLVLLDAETVETHNLMALGGIFLRAKREGLIETTGKYRQTRISRRHRKLTVWKSLFTTSD